MSRQINPSSAGLESLPSEVLLEVLSEIPYDCSLRGTLRLVNQRFKHATDSFEHCIAGRMLTNQFAWAPRQFPGLLGVDVRPKNPGWAELATVFHRIAVLSNIKSRCKIIREGRGEHSAWTTGRAITFHHTGLLLLYRLADCKSHKAKMELIRSLPSSSLAVILFSLMVSVHLLRAIGPQLSPCWSDGPLTEEARSDMELASEELLLRDGPDFLLGLLMHDMKSIKSASPLSFSLLPLTKPSALRTEITTMDSRQIHNPSDPPPEITLIASLRQAFAAAVRCEMRYNLVHMWYVLDEQCSALSDGREDIVTAAIERVVNGELLVIRCQRCRLLQVHGL
ncbi:hypothetical protein ANO11243_057780 [Dothideomycetidae sp. 11243]|nr:hypothetical protein ANO11243_057780 [fungal sp. No.11243]